MRRTLALVVAMLLATIVAAPAQAADVHRVFVASVGTNGGTGSTRITAYTDGTGRVDYALKHLRAGASYKVEVRKGRCANLGTVVARLADVRASSSGLATLGRSLTVTKMNNIWSANWSSRLAIRFVSGSSVRCGNLNFTSATRVRVPTQGVLGHGIDLAVVRAPNGYPYCNVAMYMPALNQPTEPGTAFIFAHARKGMFLPLLTEWRNHNDNRLVGMKAYVYTSNNMMYTYVIDRAWSSKQMPAFIGDQVENLVLQTSTGPNFTYPKLFLKAHRVSGVPVSRAAAHPKANVVKCG